MLIPDMPQYERGVQSADGVTADYGMMHPVKAGTARVYLSSVLQAEGVDYTLDEALGLATFALVPAAGAAIVTTCQYTILSDDQITSFLTLEGNDVRLAAAQALDTIAVNEALVQKVIKIMDLSTDGAKTAQALRDRAKSLREQVAGSGAFGWAEVPVDMFSWREKELRDAAGEGD